MLPFLLALLAFFLPTAYGGNEKLCEPVVCLTMIQRHDPLSQVYFQQSQLVGLWSSNSGLAGSNLYLFEDQSYVYTWWTDVMPEIVGDKGAWKLLSGVIYLSSQSDVSWQTHLDRRQLTVKFSREKTPSLIGIDEGLQNQLEVEAKYKLKGIVRESALRQTRKWNPEEGEKLKANTLAECWKPWWYECNQDPNKCPDIAAPKPGSNKAKIK